MTVLEALGWCVCGCDRGRRWMCAVYTAGAARLAAYLEWL